VSKRQLWAIHSLSNRNSGLVTFDALARLPPRAQRHLRYARRVVEARRKSIVTLRFTRRFKLRRDADLPERESGHEGSNGTFSVIATRSNKDPQLNPADGGVRLDPNKPRFLSATCAT
jgi:hypothetical protein